jgi:hypothetical protein
MLHGKGKNIFMSGMKDKGEGKRVFKHISVRFFGSGVAAQGKPGMSKSSGKQDPGVENAR